MRSRRFRIFALVLTVFAAAMNFAGCDGKYGYRDATDDTIRTAAHTSSQSVASTTETTAFKKIDLRGYEFLLANPRQLYYSPERATALDDELGEIYMRIENELNCTIKLLPDIDERSLRTSAMSGAKLADFIRAGQSAWIPLIAMDGLRPLDSPAMRSAGLDARDPDNFYQPYTKLSELNGHIWALDMSGKFDHTPFGHGFAFNKRLLEDAGYPPRDLYQAVRDGAWDYDMMITAAKWVTSDRNGDGIVDEWGVALDCDGAELWSNGTGPIVRDANGKWVSNLHDPRVVDSMYFFMFHLAGNFDISPVVHNPSLTRYDRLGLFYTCKAGFAGFCGENLGNAGLASMPHPFGLVPVPKGPDADGYSMVVTDLKGFVCLTSNRDWERSAVIMNEIGKSITSEDGYKAATLEMLRGDAAAYEMLFDYMLPNAVLNIANCGDAMYRLFRYQLCDGIYSGELYAVAAAEAFNAAIQTELDAVFRQ